MTPTLICADCGREAPRRNAVQKYCPGCSGRRDTARKAAWARANPQTDRRPVPHSDFVAAGALRSNESRVSITWPAEQPPLDPDRLLRVAVPFDWAASKNAVWRTGRGGHVYARREGNAFRAGLAARIRSAGIKWYTGKVWIDIFVEKPNHKGDATNMVDVVCDAVKDAIGVDDRWYSIRRLDWAIVKTDPRIYVGISQEIQEDMQVCSHCGLALPLDAFTRNQHAKNGRGRVCRECARAARRLRAQRDAAGLDDEMVA